jgi:hypothetical protein
MFQKSPNQQVFLHHIYEYKKGLRNLVLHTMDSDERGCAEKLLINKGISYIIQVVNDKKINIFFGAEVCVNIIKEFGSKSLSDYSDEEDFILGTLLGYDRVMQCERFLKRRSRRKN